MTPAQRDLRDFIVDYQNANGGVSPSFQELADGLGVTSKSHIYRMMEALKRQGRIRQRPGGSRTLEVIHDRATLYAVSTDDLLAELHSRNALARAA